MVVEIRPDRVAIYIRWSTEDQSEGTTLELQQEACESFLRSQGWVVRPDLIFIDDGYSGGNLRRPALTALRAAVRDGRVECVVAFKLDRLSRNVVDTVKLVLEEWEGRCYFKSAREPIDTTSPAGKMFFYLLASYAEWERNVIRERTAGGRLQRAQQGRWACGPTPYGYRTDEQKHLVIHEPEAAIVRSIFDGYLKGQTVGETVRRLQAEGAPAPAGPGKWDKSLVRHILSNPVYAGTLRYGRMRTNPRHGRDEGAPRLLRAQAPAVALAGAVPAIVDEGAFETVQRLRVERDPLRHRRSGRAYSSGWLLSGIARCARCGSGMAARGPRNGRQGFYYCLGRDRKFSCDCAQIKMADLDGWFIGELKRVYGDHVRRQQMLASLEQDRERRLSELRASLQTVEAGLADLERQRGVIRRRFRADEIDSAEMRGYMAEIEADEAKLRAHQAEVDRQMAAVQAQADATAVLDQLAAVDIFETLDPQAQKRLVFKLVDSLTVYRAAQSTTVQAEVVWRLPGTDSLRITGSGEKPGPAGLVDANAPVAGAVKHKAQKGSALRADA